MEEKSLDEKIKLWSRLISKSFPFIKELKLDEERKNLIFLKVTIDFFEFSKYINGELRESFIYVYKNRSAGDQLYLSIPFDNEENKEDALKFQKNLNSFFNNIIVEHLPNNYKPSKEVVFFTFEPYYEI